MSAAQNSEFQAPKPGEHLRGFRQVGQLHDLAYGPVSVPQCEHGWVLMCAIRPTLCPLKNLDNGAIGGLHDSLFHIGCQAFGAEEREVFASELQ